MQDPGDPVADTKEDDIIAHSVVGFLGSRDWTRIPISGFLKIKSRDFDIVYKTMFSKRFLVYRQF